MLVFMSGLAFPAAVFSALVKLSVQNLLLFIGCIGWKRIDAGSLDFQLFIRFGSDIL